MQRACSLSTRSAAFPVVDKGRLLGFVTRAICFVVVDVVRATGAIMAG